MDAIRPVLELQRSWSVIPGPAELLIETTTSKWGAHAFLFPFQGRLVHEGLASLIAHRIAAERPVTITCGTNRLVGTNPQKIVRAARMSLKKKTNSSRTPPLWDGKAAQRIVSVLVKHLRALNKGTSVQARRKAKVPTAMAA